METGDIRIETWSTAMRPICPLESGESLHGDHRPRWLGLCIYGPSLTLHASKISRTKHRSRSLSHAIITCCMRRRHRAQPRSRHLRPKRGPLNPDNVVWLGPSSTARPYEPANIDKHPLASLTCVARLWPPGMHSAPLNVPNCTQVAWALLNTMDPVAKVVEPPHCRLFVPSSPVHLDALNFLRADESVRTRVSVSPSSPPRLIG